MPPMALKPQAAVIPPDLAAVLADAPIHPALLRAPVRPTAPTAATVTGAALALAAYAAAHGRLPAGTEAVVHAVGGGGVLHLEPSARPRAISLAHGVLDQLRPGAVRLLPPGLAVTLADLDGSGALAVEVAF